MGLLGVTPLTLVTTSPHGMSAIDTIGNAKSEKSATSAANLLPVKREFPFLICFIPQLINPCAVIIHSLTPLTSTHFHDESAEDYKRMRRCVHHVTITVKCCVKSVCARGNWFTEHPQT